MKQLAPSLLLLLCAALSFFDDRHALPLLHSDTVRLTFAGTCSLLHVLCRLVWGSPKGWKGWLFGLMSWFFAFWWATLFFV
jgi:hypothetical protein